MRGNALIAMLSAVVFGNGFARVGDKAKPPKGWRKSHGKRGGGRGGATRYTSPRYKAWKKAFGGLAVSRYTE